RSAPPRSPPPPPPPPPPMLRSCSPPLARSFPPPAPRSFPLPGDDGPQPYVAQAARAHKKPSRSERTIIWGTSETRARRAARAELFEAAKIANRARECHLFSGRDGLAGDEITVGPSALQ